MNFIIIDTKDIADYFFEKLVRLGHVPTEEQLEDIADICLDYLYEIGVIEDIEEYDEE